MGWILAAITLAAVIYTYATLPKYRPTTQSWGKVPTAEEGLTIPVLFGTAMISSPNIVHFGDTSQELQTVLDPPVIEFRAAVQFCLCHGYVDQVVAAYSGGQEVFRWRHALEYEFDSSARNGVSVQIRDSTSGDSLIGSWRLYRGLIESTVDDGMPSDLYQTYMSTNAVGNKLWKMNGVAALTPSGPSVMGIAPVLKPLAFRVQRIWRRNGGTEQQWYPEKAAIIIGRDYTDIWKYHLQATADNTDCSGKSFDDSAWDEGRGGFGNGNVGSPGQGYYIGSNPWASRVPEVGTCVADGSNAFAWISGNPTIAARVIAGTKLWIRGDLGPLPYTDLVVRCYHDDGGSLWFNGTSITLYPMQNAQDAQAYKFNSIAYIDKDLIEANSNVIAFKATDSVPSGSTEYIYAAISVGLDANNPCATVDINPAHIIYEVLTDSTWGLGYSSDDVDTTAFETAADTLYNERLGMSLLWDQPSEIENFLSEILRHIDGVLYLDRTTGKFVLKLLRDDYEIGSLTTLDYDSVGVLDNASRKSTAELVNSVTITYWRAPLGDSGSVVVTDTGLLQSQGYMIPAKLDFPGFTNAHAANMVAQRMLRALSTPLLSCTLNNCSRKAADLQIGDAFILDWATLDIDSQVMRVTAIDVGDGKNGAVTIECIEDVFFTPTKPIAVVGGIAFPPQVLGFLPGVTTGTKFYMVKKFDKLDRTALEIDSIFIGGHVKGGNNTMFANGAFTETAPGVMTRGILGAMPSSWFDDTTPTVGKAYIAWYQGDWADNADTRYELAHEGIYRLDNVGSDTEYAQFTRLDDYDSEEDFAPGLTFEISNGTLYGGKFLQFLNPTVFELGTTLLFWTLLDSYTPNDSEALLTTEEMDEVDLLPAPVTATITVANTSAYFDLQFKSRVLEHSEIPAGPWGIAIDAVWLDEDAPSAENKLGFHVYKFTDDGIAYLFQAETASLHNEAPEPILIQLNESTYGLTEDCSLYVLPYFRTTSETDVTCNLQFNTPSKGSFVALPVEPPRITRHIYSGSRRPSDAVMAGEVITVPESTGSFDVELVAGSSVIGVSSPSPANGDMLTIALTGATGEDPITIETDADVPDYAVPIHTGDTSIILVSSPVVLILVYNAKLGAWITGNASTAAVETVIDYMPTLTIAADGKLTLTSGHKFWVFGDSVKTLSQISIPLGASDDTTFELELVFIVGGITLEHLASPDTGFARLYVRDSGSPGGGNISFKNAYGTARFLYRHSSLDWMLVSSNTK